jgi:hypothetical protein
MLGKRSYYTMLKDFEVGLPRLTEISSEIYTSWIARAGELNNWFNLVVFGISSYFWV